MNTQKNLITAVVVVLIIGSIGYLEIHKQKGVAVQGIPLTSATSTPALATSATSSTPSLSLAQKAKMYPRAVELSDPTGFINTPPFTLQSLVGNKVVLIDFWTYSCINCQRTIPYLEAWYQKYKDLGLVIVGVHTPEFDFEKDLTNVQKGVKDLGITYPVVLDSNYGTWNAYKNMYWPREMLIDIDGYIVHDHAGEGEYPNTEKAIQAALQERSDRLGLGLTIPTSIVDPSNVTSVNTTVPISEETYFGSARNTFLANGTQGKDGNQTLPAPTTITPSGLYLSGTWNFQPQYAENVSSDAKIFYNYTAKNVYMVASGKNNAVITVKRDGVVVNTVHVSDNTLYHLIQENDYETHNMELDITGTVDAFTFTFG